MTIYSYEYIRPRNEIIDSFAEYYRNFKAYDEWY